MSWPSVQLDSCWLPLTHECLLLHHYEYHAIVISVVVHMSCYWVELVIASLHWQMHIIFRYNKGYTNRKGSFRSGPAWIIKVLSVWYLHQWRWSWTPKRLWRTISKVYNVLGGVTRINYPNEFLKLGFLCLVLSFWYCIFLVEVIV